MKTSIALLMVLGFVALPRVSRAQMDDQFSWGLSAGAAIPANALAKDHDVGVNGGITFAFGGIGQLFGVRVDGMFNRFGAKGVGADVPAGTPVAGNARILGGTVNLVMGLVGRDNRVYLTGGVGGYGIRPGVKGVKGKTDFGINGGVGLWLPGVNGFIEARYHHFYRALENKRPAVFVPITLGILF